MSSEAPPVAEAETEPDAREPIAQPAADTEPEPEARAKALTVVIDDPTARRSGEPSLVEAAAAERARRASAGKSIAVITDENLAEYSEGQLTIMGEPAQSPPQPASTATEALESNTGSSTATEIVSGDPETYWRGRILEARMNWASAVEESLRLEARVAELRQRFYAEDDPYYRDAQIKPAWDRALDRLEETRAAIEAHRLEVRTILEEGRRASALPGWLREGVELEPEVAGPERRDGPTPPGEYLPGEPKVAVDPDGKPR